MPNSGDAAEQIVRMSLEGVEVAARITGAGAKQIAVLLYAILKEQKKTKGKSRLSSMLRSGKELKVFTVKNSDLKKFSREAKRYGILYCALRSINKNPDGLVDIMVRTEDASKINRIVERFNFAAVDVAAIKNEVLKSKESKEKGVEVKSKEELIIDELMKKPIKKEVENINPSIAKTEISRPSERILKQLEKSGKELFNPKKKSVREELAEIKAKQNINSKSEINSPEQEKSRDKKSLARETKHMNLSNKKKPKKSKER